LRTLFSRLAASCSGASIATWEVAKNRLPGRLRLIADLRRSVGAKPQSQCVAIACKNTHLFFQHFPIYSYSGLVLVNSSFPFIMKWLQKGVFRTVGAVAARSEVRQHFVNAEI
jgi:hypothetical protein